jgi:hypothetical protein
MNRTKEIEDVLKQRANFAVVVNTDLEKILQIKQYLVDENIQIIYQKTSVERLFIKS